ncbi:MAG: DUF2330 domain-containing protein [Deltaproteobacteria bacterium]|nr:DUF2330 domain-containing protein [Deltaproteobacteria bacterium]
MACVAGLLAGIAVTTHSREADACGACYSSSSESTVVQDHRMAFSIGKQQTVLWDSISYSGNPKEFAYVLPVKPGARLEPSNEAFFTALDASTRPIIMGPQPQGGGGGGYGGGRYPNDVTYGESGGGCCSSSATTSSDLNAGASAGSSGGAGFADSGAPPVAVVDQATVGPYETVTVRSTEPEALETWLRDHGYAIPQESSAIIAAYVTEKYDFIAMRLQPGKDVRAMQPIRIVTPGTDLSMPLRLMQIGAGAKLGITMYIIGEGRYRTTGFPDVPIDFSKLIWDYGQNRSNYQELSLAAMAKENGRAFITEYSDQPSFDPNATARVGMTSNTGLLAAYAQACENWGVKRPPLPEAGPDATSDASVDPDASDDGGSDPDASTDPDAGDTDAGPIDAGPPREVKTYCDDLDVAFEGMPMNARWVTRVRANLPKASLADTLRFEAHPSQTKFDNIHQTVNTGSIPPAQIARMRASRTHGTWGLIAVSVFVLTRILRRRRR